MSSLPMIKEWNQEDQERRYEDTQNGQRDECLQRWKETRRRQFNKHNDRRVGVEQVNQFRYLGSLISDDGACTTEIKSRITMAKEHI